MIPREPTDLAIYCSRKTRDRFPPTAGWRRPLFFGVCDFPEGFLGADGSPQSACRTARCRRVYPRQSLAERGSLREMADAKKRPSAPAGAKNADPFAVLRASSEGRRYKGERWPPRGRRVARLKDWRTFSRGDTVARWPRRRRSFVGISQPVQALSQSPLCESPRMWPWLQCPSVLHSRAACRRSCWRSSR